MALFELSKTSEREWHAAFRRTQAMGAVPICFALMIIVSMPGRGGPLIWGALGIAAGLQLVLWGGYTLHLAGIPAGSQVPESRACPALLFAVYHLFGWIILVMLWTSLAQLGFPSSVALNIVFCLMLPVIPVKAFWHDLTQYTHEKHHAIVNEALRYALFVLVALLLALAGTDAILQGGGILDEKVPAKLIWIWVGATLVTLTCLILLAEHLYAFFRPENLKQGKKAAPEPAPRRPY